MPVTIKEALEAYVSSTKGKYSSFSKTTVTNLLIGPAESKKTDEKIKLLFF